MVTDTPFKAVVMGDIVRSETSGAPERLHAQFNARIAAANQRAGAAILSPLTITLGDEFQGLLCRLADAAPLIRQLRHDLMQDAIACRFVIGLVEIRTPINRERAWNMMGPGLAQARGRLNQKSQTTLYRFSLPDHPVLERVLEALGAGLTALESRWTPRQRDDIAALMQGVTASDLARQRGVSVHNIYKVRAAGSFDAYVAQWQAITETLAGIDREKGMA